jgi:hypothetical protein
MLNNSAIKIFSGLFVMLISAISFGQTAVEDSPVSCFGGNDGQATVTPGGGIGPYPNVFWDNGETTLTAISLDAGTHSVTVEDSLGDLYSTTVIITEATEITATTNEDSPVSCFGLNDGIATVVANGGTPPYSYSWDKSASTSAMANDLAAGVHTITIQDANNCIKNAFVVITEPDELLAGANELGPVICNGENNGEAEVTVVGGSPPYTYVWDQSASTIDTATDLVAGLHTITITDANNCQVITTVSVTEPLLLSATGIEVSPVNCWGGNDGVASVTPLGGTIPYTYSWDQSSSTTETATDLVAGVHTVTITDANNCDTTVLITINEPVSELTASTVVDNDILCNGESNGMATVTAIGGTAPYSYSWDRSTSILDTASDLGIGLHTITVTDANNCITTTSVTITEPNILTATATEFSSVICNGELNGSAVVVVNGGIFPYTYSWDKSASVTDSASDLGAGQHNITITDANNCEIIVGVTITEPDELLADAAELTPVVCNGENNGVAEVTVVGGVAPYTYSWDQSPSTTATATDLVAGLHTITISDANNCEVITNVTISEPVLLSATGVEVSSVNCRGGNDGVAAVSPVGGVLPYAFIWDKSISTSETASDLMAGIHTVTITDANNCSTTVLIEVFEPTNELTAVGIVDNDVFCTGESDGMATITVTGGTAPYSYSWDRSTSVIDTASDLSVGIHTITVTDANNCQTTTDVTISEPTVLTATATEISGVICNGDLNGSAEVVVSGGTFPYAYSWDKSTSNVDTATDLSGGLHNITITDANNCEIIVSVTISEPELLTVSITSQNPICFDDPLGGIVDLEISGGSLPYFYSIDGGVSVSTNSSQINITNLSDGSHTISITDANNCGPIDFNQDISIPEEILLNMGAVVIEEITCEGSDDGAITLNGAITGGIPPYNYTWTGPSGGVDFGDFVNNLIPGTYSLSVEDSGGCVTGPFLFDIAAKLPLEITSSIVTKGELSCIGDMDATIAVQVSADPSSSLQFEWFKNGTNFGAPNTNKIENLGAGLYEVVVTDVNAPTACFDSESFQITEPEVFDAIITSFSDPSCFDDPQGGTVTIQPSGGTLPYYYSVDGGGTVVVANDAPITITGLTDGSHDIEFNDSNNCNQINLIQVITFPTEIVIDHNPADIIPVECGGGGEISVVVSGGVGTNYFYVWQGPSFAESGLNLSTVSGLPNGGIYNLTVFDENNCSSVTESFTVDENANAFTVTETITQQTCPSGTGNGSIALTIGNDIVAPYFITWEKWALSDPFDLTCTSNCYSWQVVPNSSNQLVISGLDGGEYRATITDSGGSGCNEVVKTFTILDTDLEIVQENLEIPSCDIVEGYYIFKLNNVNPVEFYLDGAPLAIGGPLLQYNNAQQNYTLTLSVGSGTVDFLLSIVEQIPDGNGGFSDGCEIFKNITVEAYEEITYGGITNMEVDVCEASPTFDIDPLDVNGGTPFVDSNGNPYYNYEWFGPDNYHSFGASIPVTAGEYSLIIIDSQECESNPIPIIFEPNAEPITIVSEEVGNVTCDMDNDGFISVDIEGGRMPFTIIWEQETSGGNYTEIAQNLLRVNNLAEGRYRLTVTSDLFPCESDNPSFQFQDIYTVVTENSISILDDPELDNELCIGRPGFVTIRAVDGNFGPINFFYEGNLVTSEALDNNAYSIFIANPLASGIIDVVNDFGCGEQVTIETGLVGDPFFTYDSDELALSGNVRTSEDIRFDNTETDYTRLEWDFGDGSGMETSEDPVHAYDSPGTYTVTLRYYNQFECFLEYSEEIQVIGDFTVQFPEVFTPNNDGINDYFQGEMIGIESFTFEIYDLWNNLLFANLDASSGPTGIWGWDGTLADGEEFNGKIFKYVFIGNYVTGEKVVISNQALLLR